MPLDPSLKNALNQVINRQIENRSTFIKTCRNPQVRETFRIRNPEDFAVGAILGGILEAFRVSFWSVTGEELKLDEAIEATALVLSRANEIRDAVMGVSN